ncbi:arabinogalactan oligomer/maltooligosaccharide transport system substrate-binding protein [Conyzicola lurida]|uniref:Arabinogalactan oligomer/maltooligosaccharide transport system substrate-binding protein n=1 Tax=Conyzicola lurida TaxID=1172621 RepID=A0A841AQ60_9MICO|nr:maltose ABC transporter substrate-binding protein [Conyzicola lurida]MBB5843705.1 arabinogalactan oligomer/maltooligosaccharide transport system substrate-binding protein [Conyzicola lurida]
MTVNIRNLIRAGAIASVAALALAGCSGGGDDTADSENTLVVWVDANRAEAIKDVVSDFESENDVTVTLVQKEFGDTLREDFIKQAPTGKGPDVVVGAHDWLGSWVQNGVVAPLTVDNAGDFEEVATQAMSYEGQQYGLPVSIENVALIRNTDLDPSAHDTFDEMIAAGQGIVSAGQAEFPFIVQLGPTADPYHLYPIQTSFGAPVFGTNADGSYNPDDLQLANAGGDEFAAKLAEWGSTGVLNINVDGDIAIETFVDKKTPYIITGPWNLERIKEAGINYSIEGVPSAGGEPSTPFVGVQGFFVSAKSNNALLANKFVVSYLGTEEVQTAIFEAGKRAPALKSAFEAAQSDPDVAAFGEVGAAGVPQPSIPAMGQVWGDWGATEAALISGTAGDTTAAWQAMAASITAKIAG